MSLYLIGTTQSISIVTGTAGDVEVDYSYVDAPNPITTSSSFTAGPTTEPANITAATTTANYPAAPGASTVRNVLHYSIFNNGALNAIQVLKVDSGGPTNTLWKGTLNTGESIKLDENGDWTYYDVNGNVKAPSAQLLQNSSTSTVSAGYASDTYLAGSSITMPSNGPHVGTRYRLFFDMVKTAAGTATFIVNVRYGTAGSTADTARLTFTFAAGTAAADTGSFELNLHFRSVGSGTSAVIVGTIKCIHALAATGLTSTGAAGSAQFTTVSSGFDSTPAGSILGVSVNGGASFSGTNTLVEAQLQV